jgi:hypothetical protein
MSILPNWQIEDAGLGPDTCHKRTLLLDHAGETQNKDLYTLGLQEPGET